MKRTLPVFTLLLSLASSGALAQDPLTDVDFDAVTNSPDVDLVIVRERSYGAVGVDLTPYGIGAGPVDFVQSIYLRLHKAGNSGNSTGFRAKVTFPAGIEVLGVIADGAPLGGSGDDGALTQTDGLFGIDPASANKYSTTRRGLESGDLFCVAAPNVVYVQPSITDGVDDVRIIIDYGNSFPQGLTFRVESADVSVPSAVPLSVGIRVGEASGIIPGSGDGGEARGRLMIPLTGTLPPVPGTGFVMNAVTTVYLARDDGAATLDAFDVNLGFLVPGILRSATPANGSALAQGPSGYLYPIGFARGAGFFDVVEGASGSTPLDINLPGTTMGVTGDGGSVNLWLTRDRVNGDSFVDRVQASSMTIQESFPIAPAVLPTPVGIVDANDGMLYVLGLAGELVQFEPSTGTAFPVWNTGQAGYAEIARDATGSTLYLLRGEGTTSTIDSFDVGSALGTLGTASFAEPSPMAITSGPNGHLHVAGDGDAGQSPAHWILDPVTGAVLSQTRCRNLAGSFFGISDFVPPGIGTSYCGPSVVNSNGRSAIIRANGTGLAGDPLQLSAWAMPENRFGFFLVGQGSSVLFPVPSSQGRLCILGSDIGRFNAPNEVQNTGTFGRFFLEIDTSALPMNPVTAAQMSETWNFQAWFRDDNPAPTSNFTNATAVTFL